MIVIGADAHKRNHTLVAVDGQTGAFAGQREIAASEAGALDALRFAAGLGDERVWAIEDCRHVSARLEAALIAAGERVIGVPGAMTGQIRKVSRRTGKSVPIDARAVALVVLRDGIESFPVAFSDEHAMEIRVLSDYRDQIITERTRMINRLRWHLIMIAPELEAQLGPASLRGPRICSAGSPSGRSTPMAFEVENLEATLADLRAGGDLRGLRDDGFRCPRDTITAPDSYPSKGTGELGTFFYEGEGNLIGIAEPIREAGTPAQHGPDCECRLGHSPRRRHSVSKGGVNVKCAARLRSVEGSRPTGAIDYSKPSVGLDGRRYLASGVWQRSGCVHLARVAHKPELPGHLVDHAAFLAARVAVRCLAVCSGVRWRGVPQPLP